MKKKLLIVNREQSVGFTLIELLVVTIILGILAGVGLVNFRTSQMKSRDAKRKFDLEQIQRALEMYFNDYGGYPVSSPAGGGTINGFSWGEEMKDVEGTIYMKELPRDPVGNPEYCYKSSGINYQIYAKLENSQDPACLGGNCATARNCGGDIYNYGVSSSNTMP